MKKILLPLTLIAPLALAGCSDETQSQADEEIIRGLKTVLVSEQEQQTTRRFPSVLQPAQVTTLSFETPGKLGEIDISVGQRVVEGQIIASLDRKALEIQLDTSKAATEQARVNAENSAATFARLDELLKSGTVTRASVDDARAAISARATGKVRSGRKAHSRPSASAKVQIRPRTTSPDNSRGTAASITTGTSTSCPPRAALKIQKSKEEGLDCRRRN